MAALKRTTLRGAVHGEVITIGLDIARRGTAGFEKRSQMTI